MAGEGSLGASFIPVFAGYLHDESRPKAWAFAQKVFWDVALALAAIALLGVVFSRQVVAMLTIFGAHQGHWELAVYLNRIMFPAVLFIGLAAIAASILNSFHVFALPAATPIFFNLSMIACSFAIIYRPILRWAPAAYRSPAVALAAGILIGGVVQLLMQIPALVRRGMKFWPRFTVSDSGVRKVGRLAAPAFFGMGVYQINIFVDTIFAASSRMPEGSITSLYVADRVMQLVLGSYAIAMSTALLPTMSHQWAAGHWSEMKRTFGFSLRIVSFITVPAALGLVLLRQPIIQVLFQHGRFTSASTALTTRALFYYSLGLPAFAGVKLIAPMYYSTHDTATPARTGAYALGLNIALNAIFLLFFFRALSNGSPALASSIAAYFNFGALFFLFRKRYGRLGARGLLQSLCKIAACAAGMGLAAYAALRFSDFESARTVLMQIGLLAGIIAAAVAAYFALAWLLRCEELGEFFLLLRRSEPATASAVESGV
jgi:putative peptidoglycan lipid II flippase